MGFLPPPRLSLPARTFTSASRLQSESAFLCTLIIDSWRRQVLPFPPFCVYLFSSLSETWRATPRCQNDTTTIKPIQPGSLFGKSPNGFRSRCRRMENKRRNLLNVSVLLQSRSSFLFNALLFLALKPPPPWPCVDLKKKKEAPFS